MHENSFGLLVGILRMLWLVVFIAPFVVYGTGAGFDFDDGTTQGWMLDQMYDTETQEYFAPFSGYVLLNSENALRAYTSALILGKPVGGDFYLESPDLTTNPEWQRILGYNLDVTRMLWSPGGELHPTQFFVQLQIKVIDAEDGYQEKLFAEFDGTDYVFHPLEYGELNRLSWTPSFLEDPRYRVKKIRLRFSGNTDWIPELWFRGDWIVDDIFTINKYIAIAEAWDAPDIPYENSAGWFGESQVTFDGVDAVRSPNIDDEQSVYIRALVRDSGSGSFWWLVSSEEGCDGLNFYIDGELQASISGDVPWSKVDFATDSEGDHLLMWEYAKDRDLRHGADAGWIDRLLWIPANLSLGEAVDAPAHSWTTMGDANWFGEASMTHDGLDAAQSGDIDNSQYNWMKLAVAGPGTGSFWWRVSSESNFDFLEFFIDGERQDRISGEGGWTQKTFVVASATEHQLGWRYRKDVSRSVGSDAGWVDQFVWTPEPSVVTVTASDPIAGEPATSQGNGIFIFTRTGSTAVPLTVNYTVGGTASSGVDYTNLGTTVSFATGSATMTKTVGVINDTLVEGDETVVVTLASGTGYTVGSPSSATVTIKDDDSTPGVILDNADTTGVAIVGTWTGTTSTPGYWRTNYLHDGNAGKGSKSVTFRPTLPSAGNYEVSVWYTAGSNRATNVPIDIVYSGGTRTVLVNERVNGGKWVVLGTNSFAAGTTGYVRIRTTGTSSGYVIADAVRFRPVAVTQVIVDNADTTGVTIVGTWTGSTSSSGYWPTNYLHDGNTGKGTKSVSFRPTLASAGNYEVSVWYTAGSNRATNVPIDIVYSGGTRTVLVNERVNGGKWVVLGTNSFAAGTTGYVRIRTTATTSGYVIADAVRFKLAGAP